MPPEADLRTPQRTSPIGALLGIFAVEQLRSLLPVVVVAASSGRFVAVVVIALLVGVTYNVTSWWRRTWWLDGGVLHLDEGILVRSERRIPLERIQHVELEQRLRHQVFGLSIVRVETAGGSGAELRLDSISTGTAEALRAEVAAGSAAAAPTPTHDGWPHQAEVLVRLPPGRLLLAGITGPEVVAVLAALAVGLDVLVDLGVDPDSIGTFDVTALATAGLVLVAVPVWLATAAVIGLVRRWDLTATIRGDDLRVTYGLLRKSEFTVDLSRVQDVRIAHRLLLRPFGRAEVRVRTAASGTDERSRVDIPLLDADEIDQVLARVLPSARPLPMLEPAPPGARRRARIRGGLAGAVLGVALGAFVGVTASRPAAAVAIVAATVAAGVAIGECAYRGLGAATSIGPGGESVLHTRAGAFTRHHEIVPAVRLQSAAVEASWFQRRRSLASVRLDLAGARVDVIDRDRSDAAEIVTVGLGC